METSKVKLPHPRTPLTSDPELVEVVRVDDLRKAIAVTKATIRNSSHMSDDDISACFRQSFKNILGNDDEN